MSTDVRVVNHPDRGWFLAGPRVWRPIVDSRHTTMAQDLWGPVVVYPRATDIDLLKDLCLNNYAIDSPTKAVADAVETLRRMHEGA